jgi:DNA-binding response OmpR family regulator
LAFNGEEGLEKAEKEKPAIILLDIMMPKMNGYEMLKILKEKKETASIPVIILSSLGADQKLIEKSKKLGVVHVIDKAAVSAKEVVERVKAVL